MSYYLCITLDYPSSYMNAACIALKMSQLLVSMPNPREGSSLSLKNNPYRKIFLIPYSIIKPIL